MSFKGYWVLAEKVEDEGLWVGGGKSWGGIIVGVRVAERAFGSEPGEARVGVEWVSGSGAGV